MNQTPEQIARDEIDTQLENAGWHVQSKNQIDLSSTKGVAVSEYQTDVGPADYVLFVNKKAVGIIEAKREEEGHKLTVVEDQSVGYARAKLKYLENKHLPFVYESTGTITRFTDYRDPKPRGRNVFSFHKPETLEQWHSAGTQMNKQNVFDDFIAAAEYLILEQYIRREKLAIARGSNGGLLVGACMTQRPDLFQVALPAVGVSLNNKTLDHECD